MYETIVGAQSTGVMTCAKHYIGYEQESSRNPFPSAQLPISASFDAKTLRELYLWPFAEAVRAGTASVMCSYNRVNGTHLSENPKIIRDILRTEWGSDALVMSDWCVILACVSSRRCSWVSVGD